MRRLFKLAAILTLFIVVLGFVAVVSVYQSADVMAQARQQAQANIRTLDIVDFIFEPDPIIIPTGETLRWTNQDGAPHTATTQATAPQAFDSGTLNMGDTFEVQLNVPGTYNYICTIHPFMQGQIIVSDNFSQGFFPLIHGQ